MQKPSFFARLCLGVGLLALLVYLWNPAGTPSSTSHNSIFSSSSPEASVAKKKARADYFFRMLRDPATNALPVNIRQRELAFAASLPTKNSLGKQSARAVTWKEAGPTDVGGRTRALAVDVANSSILIAGGASGGIWKSTNRGATWSLTSAQHLGITALAQDPRPGQTRTWYAVTGEIRGNSAGDRSARAPFYGSGLYKSTDNGDSWQAVITDTGNPTVWDAPLDYVVNLAVSPTTGTLIIATNGLGVYRSTNGGTSITSVLGLSAQPRWSDVDVASDGTFLVALSDGFISDQPGLYRSTTDGATWQKITNIPSPADRSVLAIAPSNPNAAYVMTWTGQQRIEQQGAHEVEREEITLHKVSVSTGAAEDRSANLPSFAANLEDDGTLISDNGVIDTQFSYNMVIAVKPDDENFVLLGGTSLFRSRNGFATPATQLTEHWIGGYATSNDNESYRNQHPDQHVLAFDPANPNRLYSGHDGGISVVPDVRSNAAELPWLSLNNGYNVTQYYMVSLAAASGDNRIYGGTQDNGSPFFRFNGTTATPSRDITTGDGAYAYLGSSFAIGSVQNGFLLITPYNQNNDPAGFDESGEITPPDSNQLFINPLAVDPNNENVIYYPAGPRLWRSDLDFDLGDPGWEQLDNLTVPADFGITTLAVSTTPAHVLYYGASSDNQPPKIFRFDRSDTATDGEVEVSIPGTPSGSYVHAIAVNPANADEILVVLSNYNIVGLYHSTNGGRTYTAVEGTLEGTFGTPGPSLRSATILPFGGETTYLVGTSIGAFSTTILNGSNTQWVQEAAAELGNTVVEFVTSRPSDGRIALATHGRGIFIGVPAPPTAIEENPTEQPNHFALAQNYPNPFNPTTTIPFRVTQPSRVTLSVYDLMGRKVAVLLSNEHKTAGRHVTLFTAQNLASGTYVYRLDTTPLAAQGTVTSESRRMVLAK
ncbi:MAG: T9SS type A sorting domain-containing protein [Rhodothermales bacterium]